MDPNPGPATRPTRGFTQRLKEDGRRTIEQRKRSAAERVDGIAQAIERTGAHFSDNEPTLADTARRRAAGAPGMPEAIGRAGPHFSHNEPTLADMANRLASTVSNLATRLREGS